MYVLVDVNIEKTKYVPMVLFSHKDLNEVKLWANADYTSLQENQTIQWIDLTQESSYDPILRGNQLRNGKPTQWVFLIYKIQPY